MFGIRRKARHEAGSGDGTRGFWHTSVTLRSPTCALFETRLAVGRRSWVPGLTCRRGHGLDRRRSYTRRVDERASGRVEERASGGRRLAWKTAIFSVATGLSRILGLIREIVAAYYFGATGKINAFTVAFQVPNLVRSLVA